MQRDTYRVQRFWRLSLLAACIALPLASSAAVYKCKGANGNTVFSEVPCGPDAQEQEVHAQPPISGTPAPTRTLRNPSMNLPPVTPWPAPQVVQPAQPTPQMPKPASVNTAGGLDGYLADAHLLESRQSAAPKVAIRYADSVNGALLKSVLSPARLTPLVETSFNQQDGRQFDSLKGLLLPLQRRYAQAFANSPQLYEAEYLDTLDINAIVMRQIIKLTKTTRPPMPAASATTTDGKLAQSLDSLTQSMGELMMVMVQSTAKDIRKQVADGKFSPAGAQRATGIANSLMAP